MNSLSKMNALTVESTHSRIVWRRSLDERVTPRGRAILDGMDVLVVKNK